MALPLKNKLFRLIEGLRNVVPIILVEEVTFDTANKIANVKPKIRPGDTRKIELSISTFEENVDAEFLLDKFKNFKTEVMAPRMFQYNLVAKAKIVHQAYCFAGGYRCQDFGSRREPR